MLEWRVVPGGGRWSASEKPPRLTSTNLGLASASETKDLIIQISAITSP